jgi:glycosyltransferase involved in cell wall biosynthesis
MLNLRVVSKIYDNHSLAIVTRKLCVQLIKNNWANLSIIPLDSFNPAAKVSKDELMTIKPFINKQLNKVDIELRHSYPPILAWPDSDATKIVYIQPWEYNRMPIEWKNTFQDFADLVIVPSNWVKNVYLDSGIKPSKVKVIPNGYDPEVYNRNPINTTLLDSNKFIFTFVGNAQYRKGMDIVFQAWHKAFVKADNAVLFVKDTPAIYGTSNILENCIQMQYKTGCGKIIYNDDNLSEEEMAQIYKNTDVILHPYRGEGFGMHLQEAMACGALPLVTGVGAADDFINETCGIKLNARRNFIDANDPKYFIGKSGDSYTLMGMHFWVPEVDVEDLIGKMKYLYFHHDRNKILDKVDNAKLTTWQTAAENLVGELTALKENKSNPCRIK